MTKDGLGLLRYYSGNPDIKQPTEPVQIPYSIPDSKPHYIANEQLVDAVNVALMLSQPLLVTGEPGTGKTQLAYSIGRELGYEVRKYETKSTSTYRDLFYRYDALTRFQDVQNQVKREPKDYITFDALGIAILETRELSEVKQWLPPGFDHQGPRRSVVLIDEIDKAPRDFPNDLLNEIEGMYFKIPELGLVSKKIEARADLRPVIIITSNTERNLPDPFLRRCIYYDIPFPDTPLLTDIVLPHLESKLGNNKPAWLDEAIRLFNKFRRASGPLEKKPSTAELLNWVTYLQKAGLDRDTPLREQESIVKTSLSALLKSQDEQHRADEYFEDWLQEPPDDSA